MKIVVFEDEIYNFHLIRHKLEEMDSRYDVIGPITTVEQGREYLSLHHDTDVIIADVELSDGLCFDALHYAPSNVPIVFMSHTEEHAFAAFDFYSLSYLLKPVGDGMLAEAMRKVRQLIVAVENPVSDGMAVRGIGKSAKYRERFVVKAFNGERAISLSTIQYIVSEQKSTYLVLLDGTSCPIDLSLEAVAQQLDPAKFMRVNRKYIVPIEQVCGMERLVNGKELLKLKTVPSPEIIVSRTRKAQVRKWLDC